jgi:phage protein D
MQSIKPQIQVLYNSKDITTDITKYLLEFKYSDKLEGQSDEIEILLEDAERLWQGEWIAGKGDKIEAYIGYAGKPLVNCGKFSVDEINLSGSPDVVSIRAIGAGINNSIRTRKSFAHEKKTLRQIAQAVADANGMTLQGTIPDILIERSTQNRESDLGFLRRLAQNFGLIFSVRDNLIIFTDMFEIEAANSVLQFGRTDVRSFDFTDSAVKTYKSSSVGYRSPETGELVVYNQNNDLIYKTTVSGDRIIIKDLRVENKGQAERVATVTLHQNNTAGLTGRLRLYGNELCLSGSNIELDTSWKRFSGKYQITASTHIINKNVGYTTDIDIKGIPR